MGGSWTGAQRGRGAVLARLGSLTRKPTDGPNPASPAAGIRALTPPISRPKMAFNRAAPLVAMAGRRSPRLPATFYACYALAA